MSYNSYIPEQNPRRFATYYPEMAFAATPNFVGVPEFGITHINPEETAKAFQAYLDTASKLTGVSLDDISRRVIKMPADPATVTLVGLLEIGMKLFDAIVWLTAKRPSSHPLSPDPGMKKEDIPSMHEIARSVFYCYFMLITQARYPVSENIEKKPKIPNFLTGLMGLSEPQHYYVDMICSFEVTKFDPKWARFVNFTGFGQEVLSRFGLGVAGYRMFGPFGLYSPKADMKPELQPAFNFAKKIATSPASWGIHPLTRDPKILTMRGNLNKNLANLIHECFSAADIENMVTAKVIYETPKQEPGHRQYLQWTEEDNISGTQWVFP